MISTSASFAPMNMVLGQLLTNEVQDARLLNAILSVPREECVPERLRGAANVDDELPLGGGRFLIAPLPFARLLQLARISPDDKVLEIGCTQGWTTGVIARLAREVTGCEVDREMALAAKRNLERLGISNARAACVEKLSEGYASDAPYDLIIVSGAMACAPAALLRLLAPGGRLVGVEQIASRPGIPGGIGRLVEYVLIEGQQPARKEGREASVPLLPGFAAHEGFRF